MIAPQAVSRLRMLEMKLDVGFVVTALICLNPDSAAAPVLLVRLFLRPLLLSLIPYGARGLCSSALAPL